MARRQGGIPGRYGGPYQAARKRALPRLRAGTDCARCGGLVDSTMPADFDHLEDGSLDWSHRKCNRSAGGKVGRAAQLAVLAAKPRRVCVICGAGISPSAIPETVTCGGRVCVTEIKRLRHARQPDPEPPVTAGRVW